MQSDNLNIVRFYFVFVVQMLKETMEIWRENNMNCWWMTEIVSRAENLGHISRVIVTTDHMHPAWARHIFLTRRIPTTHAAVATAMTDTITRDRTWGHYMSLVRYTKDILFSVNLIIGRNSYILRMLYCKNVSNEYLLRKCYVGRQMKINID